MSSKDCKYTDQDLLTALLQDPESAERLIVHYKNLDVISQIPFNTLEGLVGPANAEHLQVVFYIGRRMNRKEPS